MWQFLLGFSLASWVYYSWSWLLRFCSEFLQLVLLLVALLLARLETEYGWPFGVGPFTESEVVN